MPWMSGERMVAPCDMWRAPEAMLSPGSSWLLDPHPQQAEAWLAGLQGHGRPSAPAAPGGSAPHTCVPRAASPSVPVTGRGLGRCRQCGGGELALLGARVTRLWRIPPWTGPLHGRLLDGNWGPSWKRCPPPPALRPRAGGLAGAERLLRFRSFCSSVASWQAACGLTSHSSRRGREARGGGRGLPRTVSSRAGGRKSVGPAVARLPPSAARTGTGAAEACGAQGVQRGARSRAEQRPGAVTWHALPAQGPGEHGAPREPGSTHSRWLGHTHASWGFRRHQPRAGQGPSPQESTVTGHAWEP